MKIATYLTVLFTATALAAPAARTSHADADADAFAINDAFLAIMKEVAPLLPTSELWEHAIPTQAACYTACDRGSKGVRAFCAILPPTPIKVFCFGSATVFGSVFGQRVCRQFCNRFA